MSTDGPLADGWSTVPADGLYVVYIPRSFTLCEVRALELGQRLRKGWRVWGPFDSVDDCREPLEALRLYFREETEQKRGRPALEPLSPVVDNTPPETEPTTLNTSELETMLRRIVREELERFIAQ